MDSRRKKLHYALGGLSVSVIGASLYLYFQDDSTSLDIQISHQLQTIQMQIQEYFKQNSQINKVKQLNVNLQLQLSQMNQQKDLHLLLIEQAYSKFVDQQQLYRDLDQQAYFSDLAQAKLKNNHQKTLTSIDTVTSFLTTVNIDIALEKLQSVPKEYHNNHDCKLSDQIVRFARFTLGAFFLIIKELELFLLKEGSKQELVQINYFFGCLLDFISNKIKLNQKLSYLVGYSLLLQMPFEEDYPYFLLHHKCDDVFFEQKVSQSIVCRCCVIDLLFRYYSLFSPKLQMGFFNFSIEHQLFFTKEQITTLTSSVLKNSFYLASQIEFKGMHFVNDIQPAAYLCILGAVQNQIMVTLLEDMDILFFYFERLISNNKPKFWSKALKGIVAQHVIMYNVIADPACSKKIGMDEKLRSATIIHFLGILLYLETQETFEVKKEKFDNEELLKWLAENMDVMFATEVVALLQKVLLRELIRNNISNYIFIDHLCKSYMQCIRVSQNRRIEQNNNNQRFLEVNCSLTKLFGFIFAGLCERCPKKSALKQTLQYFNFIDKQERRNIFSNFLRILFDLLTMNLQYLRYVQPKCEKISTESSVCFNAFFTHILTSQTIQYDLYIFSMQLGYLFGEADLVLTDIKNKLYQDIQQFDEVREFFFRDVIQLVDMIENPYYFYNIAAFFKQGMNQHIIERAVIAISQLNGDLQENLLNETVKMFLHISEIPEDLKKRLFNGKRLTLGKQYQNRFYITSLQKDIESVRLYIQYIEKISVKENVDMFYELFEENDIELGFLINLQNKFFLSIAFQQLLSMCIFSQKKVREALYPWCCKLLFIGKQVLKRTEGNEKKRMQHDSLRAFMDSDNVKRFLTEMKKKNHCRRWVEEMSK